jgi:hypothetical protein
MLHVVQAGQRMGTVSQRWMAPDISDLFAVEPDFTPLLP